MAPKTRPLQEPPRHLFSDMSRAQAAELSQKMAKFIEEWIPNTIRIYGVESSSLHYRLFWEGTLRFDLSVTLWSKEYLGREPTEHELDWLVKEAIDVALPQIQYLVIGYANRENAPEQPKKTRLRRRMFVEDMMKDSEEIDEVLEGEERRAEQEGVADLEENGLEDSLELMDLEE